MEEPKHLLETWRDENLPHAERVDSIHKYIYDYASEQFPKEAVKLCDEEIDLLIGLKDHQRLANAHALKGVILQKLGELKDAKRATELSLQHYELAEDKIGMVRAYNNISYLLKQAGDYENALQALQEANKISDEVDSPFGAFLRMNEALILKEQKQYDRSLDLLEEGLQIAREKENEDHIRSILINRANIYFELGDYDSALPIYESCLEMAKSAKDPFAISQTLINVGTTLLEKKEIESGLEKLEESRKISLKHDFKYNLGLIESSLGNHYLKQQLPLKALRCFHNAYGIHLASNHAEEISYVRSSMSLSVEDIEKKIHQVNRLVEQYEKTVESLNEELNRIKSENLVYEPVIQSVSEKDKYDEIPFDPVSKAKELLELDQDRSNKLANSNYTWKHLAEELQQCIPNRHKDFIPLLKENFQEQTGMTINQWLKNSRLHLARKLVLHTKLKVNEVSKHSGLRYLYPGNFTREYRSKFGLTPRNDREAMLRKQKKSGMQEGQ